LNFRLPKNVKVKHKTLSGGVQVFEFRHNTLGKLGRILLQDMGGQAHISAEVAGSPDDPRTARRETILEPIVKAISAEIDGQLGTQGIDVPPVVPEKSDLTEIGCLSRMPA
jgi:hypothetical protein